MAVAKTLPDGTSEPALSYLGDSDAHIVRGLIAILLTLYSGKTPQENTCRPMRLRCSTNSNSANT